MPTSKLFNRRLDDGTDNAIIDVHVFYTADAVDIHIAYTVEKPVGLYWS